MNPTAPSRQLARVKSGQAVGVITTPADHRLLIDATTAAEGKALRVRINSYGAFCSEQEVYLAALETKLEKADGEIVTAPSRRACKLWPSRYSHVGGDGR